MAPPVAWQTHPPQRSPEVPVKGLRARPEGRPGHGRLGVAHTEVTGFTCRGAGRSPSGVPCLPRQRIKGFESRSEQDDSYICCSICDPERESHEEPARAHHGARRRPRRSARPPCFTSAKGPRWVRRSLAWPVQAGSCGSAKGSTCARSRPASGGVRRAPRSHSWRSRSSGARRSSRTRWGLYTKVPERGMKPCNEPRASGGGIRTILQRPLRTNECKGGR